MCCSVLQCVAVCCSVLQCVAVCCSVLQCVAVRCSVLQCVAVCCSVMQCVAVCCAVWCSPQTRVLTRNPSPKSLSSPHPLQHPSLQFDDSIRTHSLFSFHLLVRVVLFCYCFFQLFSFVLLFSGFHMCMCP